MVVERRRQVNRFLCRIWAHPLDRLDCAGGPTGVQGVAWLTYEDAVRRLVELAKENGGTVTAAQVEADPELSANEEMASAAARALGGSTNVFSSSDPDGRTWFPFSSLLFSEIPTGVSH
jgi:hypothetical protein